MHLRCMLVMLVRMQRMAVRDLAMVLGRMLVVVGGPFMVLVNTVIVHRSLPGLEMDV
jgi:hypothetical protein